MREILFRGKRADNGKWTTGTPFFVKGRCKMIHAVAVHPDFLDEGNVYYSEGYPVIDDTIGQYTGLTDKNGTKIFEGDIVRFSLITGRSLVPQGLRQVTFSAGSFMIEDPYSGDDETISRIAASVELEVVGNVHDNPDMIADYIQSVRQELMEAE